MATTEHQEQQKRKHGIFAASSAVESLVGLGAVVLAILGLANVLPVTLASIAVIVLGVGLFLKGGAIMARYADLVAHYGSGAPEITEFGGGTSVEFLGGIAGIALGILCLLRVEQAILLPVSVIMFGAVLLIGAGVLSRISHERLITTEEPIRAPREETPMVRREEPAMVRREAEEAMNAAAGMETFVGVSAIALGILALIGYAPLTLVLVGLLVTGASVFFSATAVGARMAGVFAH
ncbi:MAG: hypothetical protein NTZ09_04435 [Candidatus Hydrogenedentes bacterium]|nr:hypothetical protein [Candidatus Hydrogenedentota bacterium]